MVQYYGIDKFIYVYIIHYVLYICIIYYVQGVNLEPKFKVIILLLLKVCLYTETYKPYN